MKSMFRIVLDMFTILLHHGGKTTTPFADAPVEKRLAELVPRLDNCVFARWRHCCT